MRGDPERVSTPGRTITMFGRMVPVDLDVALGVDGQIEGSVPRNLLQHVGEEGQGCFDAGLAGPVEVDLDPDLRFPRLTFDRCNS